MAKESFVRTVRKSGTSLSVNIPPEIIELLGIKDGDIARIEIERLKENGNNKNKKVR